MVSRCGNQKGSNSLQVGYWRRGDSDIRKIIPKLESSVPEESHESGYGPARQKLDVMEQFEEVITYGDNSSKQIIFVIRNLKVNLLGFPAITAFNILKRADAVVIEEKTIKQQFSKVFSGLGDLGEEYHIQLKESAHPYCLYTPRNVPIPLKEKVQVELDKMDKMGVISRVNKPTEWCAGMVVVPKKSGEVRICVDLKALNDNVLHEVHPIPKVDETLAQLVGVKIFSKLDANSGFWQIPLADDSRLLTTFVPPMDAIASINCHSV